MADHILYNHDNVMDYNLLFYFLVNQPMKFKRVWNKPYVYVYMVTPKFQILSVIPRITFLEKFDALYRRPVPYFFLVLTTNTWIPHIVVIYVSELENFQFNTSFMKYKKIFLKIEFLRIEFFLL